MSDNKIRRFFKGHMGIGSIQRNGYVAYTRTALGRPRTPHSTQMHYSTVNKIARNRLAAKAQRLARRFNRK